MTDGARLAPRGHGPRGALFMLLLAAGCAAPVDEPARPELTLDLGGAQAADAEALLGGFGATFPVAKRWTLGARAVAYDFEMSESGTLLFEGLELDARQETSGEGLGGGLELRFYPRRALDGFWLGLGALYFPWVEFESTGTATERLSGASFSAELEAEEIDFVPYGAVGWTFRLPGRLSLGLRASAGSAAGEAFGTFGLQLGFSL